MKNLILFLLIAIPSLCFAQTKHVWKYNIMEDAGSAITLSPPGTYLLTASRDMLIGTGLELGGAGIAIIAGQGEAQAGVYLGGAMAAAGLIFQIVGYTNIGKAAKTFQVTGNGVSFAF